LCRPARRRHRPLDRGAPRRLGARREVARRGGRPPPLSRRRPRRPGGASGPLPPRLPGALLPATSPGRLAPRTPQPAARAQAGGPGCRGCGAGPGMNMSQITIVLEPGRAERHYWRDLWGYRELLFFLAWRDVAVHYKQTVIGVAW